MDNLILSPISIEDLSDKVSKNVLTAFYQALKGFNQKDNGNNLLSRKETASYLKINLSTLHNWQKKGLLPTYSIGNRIYFKRCDIDKALIKIN
jgi:excisionase family DNA binding protein